MLIFLQRSFFFFVSRQTWFFVDCLHLLPLFLFIICHLIFLSSYFRTDYCFCPAKRVSLALRLGFPSFSDRRLQLMYKSWQKSKSDGGSTNVKSGGSGEKPILKMMREKNPAWQIKKKKIKSEILKRWQKIKSDGRWRSYFYFFFFFWGSWKYLFVTGHRGKSSLTSEAENRAWRKMKKCPG